MNPNAKVKEGYHSKLIVTDDGRVVTGIPVRESATTDGLAAWLDGKPIQVTPPMTFELARGLHTLTFDINHTKRSDLLRLELTEAPGSGVQVQLIAGKPLLHNLLV